MVILGIPVRFRQVAFVVGDVAVALMAVQLGHVIRLWYGGLPIPGLPTILGYTTGASLLFVIVHVMLLYVVDAYGADHDYRERRMLVKLWAAVLMGFGVLMMLQYALPFWRWPRGVSLYSFLSFGVLLTAWRSAISRARPRRQGRFRTLIVGAGEAGRAIVDVIRSNAEHRSAQPLVGLIDDVRETGCHDLEVLGGSSDLLAVVKDQRIKRLIVAVRGTMGPELISTLLRCKTLGVQIVDMPTVYKNLTGKLPIRHLAGSYLIFGPGFTDRPTPLKAIQRLVDVTISVAILVAVSPVLLVAALAVKLTDGGPILFTQERLGKNEKPFRMFKLRTMVVDAEAKTGAVWSQGSDDPRVTRIGRFLRRSRLDEVPQLWNVIRGDMAMVGPRPEREHFVRKLEEEIPYYSLRFASKPGVTGWAQVMYRYGASVEDSAVKLQYELYSVQEMTPALYSLILFKTVQTVLIRPGS
jgi:exopolysaccharide biosynthesis polyprenyl glycosylphosphotransferase